MRLTALQNGLLCTVAMAENFCREIFLFVRGRVLHGAVVYRLCSSQLANTKDLIPQFFCSLVVCVLCIQPIVTSVGRGSDFRPSFSKLGGLRAHTDVPFMALTATSSESTQSTIVKLLDMKQPIIVSHNLDRPNIYFSTSPIKSLSVRLLLIA